MPGRMEAAMSEIDPSRWEIVAPADANREHLSLAHDEAYIARVAEDGPRYAMAILAAGGALAAARIAYDGEPAFACIRPPGHHASRAEGWGYCSFNNLVIALFELRRRVGIESAFVIDIDQHTGDGTRKLLSAWPRAMVYNPFAENAREYLEIVESRLDAITDAKIIAVSAGFDGYKLDQGHKLDTEDYRAIGSLIKTASERVCAGRRFAVLEGGYYLPDLGKNLRAFCEGFE